MGRRSQGGYEFRREPGDPHQHRQGARSICDDGLQRLQPPGSALGGSEERIFETAGRLGRGRIPWGVRCARGRTWSGAVLESASYAFDDPAAVSFLGGLSSVTEEADLGLLLVPAAGGGAFGERDPRAAHRPRWTGL